MRITKTLIIITVGFLSGIVINSCCEGFNYEWTYILTDNLCVQQKSNSDSIPAESFGLRVHMFDRKYSNNLRGQLISESFAFDCEETYHKDDSIIDINIFTINVIDSVHNELSNVNDLFFGNSIVTNNINVSLSELINQINKETHSEIEYFDLLLKHDRIFEATHQFVIQIDLSDNRMLIDTTNQVILY